MTAKITVSVSMADESGEKVDSTATVNCLDMGDYNGIAACIVKAMSPLLADEPDIGGLPPLVVSDLIRRLGVTRQCKTIEAFGCLLYLAVGRDIDKAGIITPNWDGLDMGGEDESFDKQRIIELLGIAADPIPS